MSVENLDKIFQPNSIAVVGASERKGSVGAALMHNLIERGFCGEIFPVNPNHKKIGRLPAYPSIRDFEVPVDLVISPYPDQYEEHTQTSTGIDIFVRPIRPEDAPLLIELFESLSPQSVYRRFFTPLKRLPPTMLARFTQIDYDRHIAPVALSESNWQDSMLGVARVILERNQKEAEFSIVVGDPWQGKGIGAALLHRCISIAKERGIEKIMGIVVAENTQMLTLGKKLGFKINKVIGAGEHELSINFQTK